MSENVKTAESVASRLRNEMEQLRNTISKVLQDKKIEHLSECNARLTELLQDQSLFAVNYHREKKLRTLKLFGEGDVNRKIILGPILKNVQIPGYEIEILQDNFLTEVESKRSEILSKISSAYVMLNNNDFSGATPEQLAAYQELYLEATDTIFIVWDCDNHHWLRLGLLLALHSDYYVPAHPENYAVYSKFNSNIQQHMPLGCVQWSVELLKKNIDLLIGNQRSDLPLGFHGFYSCFTMRNSIISTMAQHSQSIGFSSGAYREKKPEENLLTWASHKIHFVAPVNSDLPYRIFDGLLTGGVVMVPEPLHSIARPYMLHKNIVTYTEADILDPGPLFKRALVRFKEFRAHPNRKQILLDLIDNMHASAYTKNIISNVNIQQHRKVDILND
jgi:hypothetical protein